MTFRTVVKQSGQEQMFTLVNKLIISFVANIQKNFILKSNFSTLQHFKFLCYTLMKNEAKTEC
jgi:hypothetical protein